MVECDAKWERGIMGYGDNGRAENWESGILGKWDIAGERESERLGEWENRRMRSGTRGE